MRDKVVQFVKDQIEKLDWQEPVWEFCSGWDPSIRQVFKGKDYHSFDQHQWGGVDVVGNVKDLSLESEVVGLALMLEALEHIDESQKAIDEIYRVMRPGAYLILTTHMAWELHGTEQYGDYWRFLPDGLNYLLRKFEDVEITLDGWSTQPSGIWAVAKKPGEVSKKSRLE